MTAADLKRMLTDNGLSVTEAAEETGYNRSTIHRYMSGETPIPQKFVISLRNVLQGATR